MKRRFLSLLLAAVMAFTLTAPALGAGEETEAEIDTSAAALEGTTPLGRMIAAEAVQTAAAPASAGGCAILDVVMEGVSADVTLSTDRAADVVVALYDEDSGQMLNSAYRSVQAGIEQVEIYFNSDSYENWPESYELRAYLLDASTHEPLCDDCVITRYTRAMQDLENKGAGDFDPGLVLNLDGRNDTNFLVYDKSVTLVSAADGRNILEDKGNGTYVVTNADDTFTGLKPGDRFSYTAADGTVLPVLAAEVTVSGSTVTIRADQQAALGDFFDVVKVQAGSPVTAAAETAPAASTAEGGTVKTIDIAARIALGPDVDAGSVGAHGELTLTAWYSLYMSGNQRSGELGVNAAGTVSIEIQGKVEKDIDLVPAPVPMALVPGVTLTVTPKLILSAEASVNFRGNFNGTLWYTYENESVVNKSVPMTYEPEVTVEGEFFVGIGLEAAVAVISQKLDRVSLTGTIGVEITATMSNALEDRNVRHSCDRCIDGDFTAAAELTVEIYLVRLLKLEQVLGRLEQHLGDFYYSIDHGQFGLGDCPYITYRVVAYAEDEQGRSVSGAVIGGTGLTDCPVTGGDGSATFYLPDGEYALAARVADGSLSSRETPLKINGDWAVVYFEMVAAPEPVPDPLAPGGGSGLVTWGFLDYDTLSTGTFPPYDPAVPYYDPNVGLWCLYGNGTVVFMGNVELSCNSRFSPSIYPWKTAAQDFGIEIRSVVIHSGITGIGGGSFAGCKSLRTVTIPDTVTIIGYDAFSGTGLRHVVLPEGVTDVGESAFAGCESLESISLPDSLRTIWDYTFEGCTSLTGVDLPDGLVSIGYAAFEDCVSLTSIEIPDSVTELGDNDEWSFDSVFSNCSGLVSAKVGSGVRMLKATFYNCNSLEDVELSYGLESIGQDTFYGCRSLRTINIPDSVMQIYNYWYSPFSGLEKLESVKGCGGLTSLPRFSDCPALKDVELSYGLTEIPQEAFSGCTSLQSIHIPESVTSIGDSAFSGCTALQSITIPNSVTEMGTYIFSGCTALKDVELSYGPTEIALYAFENCTALESVDIPDSVTSIGGWAFSGCTALESITIPEGVTNIGTYAFSDCTALRSIRIPDSVTSMGDLFSGCTSLSSVTLGRGLPSFWAYDLPSLRSLTILNPMIGIWGEYDLWNGVLENLYYNGTLEQWQSMGCSTVLDASAISIYLESTGPGTGYLLDPSMMTALAEVTAEPADPEPSDQTEEAVSPAPEATAEPTPPAAEEEPAPTASPEPTEEPADPEPSDQTEEAVSPAPEATAEPTPPAAEEEPAPTAAPEVTAEPSPPADEGEPAPAPEPTPEPVPEIPEEPGVAPTRATQQLPAGDIVLVAAFEPENAQTQYVSFRGLRPGGDYVILALADLGLSSLLWPGNLLYIIQVAADSSGSIDLAYTPCADTAAQLRAYGPELWDRGDTDHDGAVTLKDVTRLYQYVHEQNGVTVEPETGDVFADEGITDRDVRKLFKFVTGEIRTLN